MSGVTMVVRANTKAELEKQVGKTLREAKSMGLTDLRFGWDPERVVRTENGYEIVISVKN